MDIFHFHGTHHDEHEAHDAHEEASPFVSRNHEILRALGVLCGEGLFDMHHAAVSDAVSKRTS